MRPEGTYVDGWGVVNVQTKVHLLMDLRKWRRTKGSSGWSLDLPDYPIAGFGTPDLDIRTTHQIGGLSDHRDLGGPSFHQVIPMSKNIKISLRAFRMISYDSIDRLNRWNIKNHVESLDEKNWKKYSSLVVGRRIFAKSQNLKTTDGFLGPPK